MSDITLYEKIYGKEVLEYFERKLIGKTIESYGDVVVEKYVMVDLRIGGEDWVTRYRIADADEEEEGREIIEDYLISLKEICERDYVNGKVEKIEIVVGDREFEDEMYLSCLTNFETVFHIPLGFDIETEEFSLYSEEIISKEDRDLYTYLKKIFDTVFYYDFFVREKNFEKQSKFYRRILEIVKERSPELMGDVKMNYSLADFNKLNELNQLFDEKLIRPKELYDEILNIVLT